MKKLILLFLALVFLLGVLFTVVVLRYGAARSALEKEFEIGVQKRQAILDADVSRPVLRGEAKPGDGGHVLDSAWRRIGEHDRATYGKHPAYLLSGLLDERLDPEEVEIAEKAFNEMKTHIQLVRDAIQHESCRLPQVADRWAHDQLPDLLWTFAARPLLLLEAEDLAGRGDLSGALATIADTMRVGHDLSRGTPSIYFWGATVSFERDASLRACTFLYSQPFAPKELSRFLVELSVLEESRPSLADCLEGEEYEVVIEIARRLQGRSSRGPLDIWGKAYFSFVDLDLEEHRRIWDRYREAYSLPIREMRKASDELKGAARSSFLASYPRLPRDLRELELESQTAFACLQAAVMVHRYRLEHQGAWPEGLAALGEVPLDPWDGQPLRFKPAEEDRPSVIYSVGANLVDDGGKADKPFGLKVEEGDHDFLFPLGPWPAEDQPSRPPR